MQSLLLSPSFVQGYDVAEIQAAGIVGFCSIAAVLNERGIRTSRGARWHGSTVRNILERTW
jgi:hypothetical protein